MVREGNGLVYLHGIGFEVLRTEYVVNAHVNGVAIKRTSYAIGCGTISVGETTTHAVVSV